VLGLSTAELGSSAHALERTWPRINRTPTIARTTVKLECTYARAYIPAIKCTRRAQCGRHLLTV
jgi:hypothetical protein